MVAQIFLQKRKAIVAALKDSPVNSVAVFSQMASETVLFTAAGEKLASERKKRTFVVLKVGATFLTKDCVTNLSQVASDVPLVIEDLLSPCVCLYNHQPTHTHTHTQGKSVE